MELGIMLNFGSKDTVVETEVLLYPFTSFLAEFGGALGLFLGFSFIQVMAQVTIKVHVPVVHVPRETVSLLILDMGNKTVSVLAH